MRSVVLDTETTGMPVTDGHRVIEIGGVEIINRRLTGRTYHVYLQPDREIDEGATNVHGIRDEDLVGKPRFADVADEFYEFIKGAQVIAHNAAFDVAFLNREFALLGQPERAELSEYCTIVDTLAMARSMHPGQRNSLDALCKRYGVDNSARELHGALLDAEILADVFLAMTGGQTNLSLAGEGSSVSFNGLALPSEIKRLPADRARTRVVYASPADLAAHSARLAAITKASGAEAIWVQLEKPADSQ